MNTEPPLYLLASWRLRCLWKDWFIGVLLTWAIKKEQRGGQGHAMLPNHSRGESINDTGSDASRQQQPKSHIQHGDITQNDANIGTSLWIIGLFRGGVGGCCWGQCQQPVIPWGGPMGSSVQRWSAKCHCRNHDFNIYTEKEAII